MYIVHMYALSFSVYQIQIVSINCIDIDYILIVYIYIYVDIILFEALFCIDTHLYRLNTYQRATLLKYLPKSWYKELFPADIFRFKFSALNLLKQRGKYQKSPVLSKSPSPSLLHLDPPPPQWYLSGIEKL